MEDDLISNLKTINFKINNFVKVATSNYFL